ncbi:hypothetical protein [Streptomyces carminius]|uniref:hypothetical protein n=1 Tax=Streptomyces carminius TaxID=2665496 RepID=UPI0018EAEF76|nr:hypothetical protein [Streptomyces carminius]
MLPAEVAHISRRVADTPSRTGKTALLAGLLRRTYSADAPVVITCLAGRLPQRRTGIARKALREEVSPAAESTLAVRETHPTPDEIAAVSGKGAQAARTAAARPAGRRHRRGAALPDRADRRRVAAGRAGRARRRGPGGGRGRGASAETGGTG